MINVIKLKPGCVCSSHVVTFRHIAVSFDVGSIYSNEKALKRQPHKRIRRWSFSYKMQWICWRYIKRFFCKFPRELFCVSFKDIFCDFTLSLVRHLVQHSSLIFPGKINTVEMYIEITHQICEGFWEGRWIL